MRPARAQLALALAGAAVALVVATGCGAQAEADLENGRALFIERCGTCHRLDEAATTATVAPDLDAAFADARKSGMTDSTIEGVVAKQIEHPRPADPETPEVYMPANLVTGDDAHDVAAYVGEVAGVPGIEPPEAPGGPGGQVFANYGCAACHVFAAAEATGQTGPDLDEVLPGQNESLVRESIVDPEARITEGFPSGVMPSDYEAQIPPDELDQLVEFLLENAGNGNGGGGNGGGGN